MAKVTWNQDEYESAEPRNYEPLPRGGYVCKILDSEEKKTSAGNGSFFAFSFAVVEGDFKNRRLWANLNVNNPSEVAQRIGREQYKALCDSAGKPGCMQTEKLHERKVMCFVSIEKDQNGNPRNRVDGFGPPDTQVNASAPRPAAPPASKPATATAGGPEEDDIPF